MNVRNPADYAGKVILGIGAHPDDMDFTAAGTIASLVKAGATAYYLVLSDGSKGTGDRTMAPAKLTEIRKHEQQLACNVLGIKETHYYNHEDGCMAVNNQLKRDIVECIRRVKPNAVFLFDPTMVYTLNSKLISINHPDHRAVGQAALDAVFPLAGNHLCMSDMLEDGLEPHTADEVYLVNMNEANCYFDITETLPLKMKALAAHASQIADMEKIENVLTEEAAVCGKKCGVQYAEGFIHIDVL